jgi:hypothetical protein
MTTTQTPPEVVIHPGQTTIEDQLSENEKDEKKDRQSRQNAAYTKASARLREAHREEFDGYLGEEYEAVGLTYRRRATAEEREQKAREERMAKAQGQFEKLMEDFPEFRQALAAKALELTQQEDATQE